MRQNPADINHIRLHGTLSELPSFSHANHGVAFVRFQLKVSRLSEIQDVINVVAPQELVEQSYPLQLGGPISIQGEVRSFNNRTGTGNRLVISTFAQHMAVQEDTDINEVALSGTLCKPPVLRTTPLGRTICDMILAVNRRYGRADYLPCIAWGSLAHRCGALGVGDQVHLSGRLQSRQYTKLIDEQAEERTAYEVSVMALTQPENVQV